MGCTNLQKHFDSAAKIATCRIEEDVEAEMVLGVDEVLRVTTDYNGEYQMLGEFHGSWEFEAWLCSDLPYEEWRKRNPFPKPLSE